MAGGGFASGPSERAHLYEYRITAYFIFACIVAALGGSLFGYDLGVSGHFFFFFPLMFCMNVVNILGSGYSSINESQPISDLGLCKDERFHR